MKINVAVELDWIEDDGNIDDEIKSSIIHGVKNAISKSCLADMESKSKAAFDTAVMAAASKIDQKALEFADSWLENEVTVTDKYGDPLSTGTVKDLIKKSFDNLLERRVDENGNFTENNGYGKKYKLIEYLTNKRVEQEVSSRMKNFGKDIDKRIDESIQKSIKDNVSDRFAQMVIGAAKQDYQETKALEGK